MEPVEKQVLPGSREKLYRVNLKERWNLKHGFKVWMLEKR
jgi:hypothetical protein